MTGELADGWLGTSFMPEHANVFLDPMKKGAEKSGRTLADVDIQVGVSFEIGSNIEEMIEARKPGMAFTLGGMGSAKTNFYNDAFRRSGYEEAAIAVQDLWVQGKKSEAIQRVPDEMILLTSLIGTEEMIKERLKAYTKAGVNTLRLGTTGSTWKERRESLEQCLDLIKD